MYDPQGPTPSHIYARRRLAAVIAVVVVIAAVVAALALAARDDKSESSDNNSASGSGTTDSEVNAAVTSSGAPATSATPTSDSQSASAGSCADEDLKVVVWPERPTANVGQGMYLFAQITNISDTACDRDLAQDPLAFEIFRMDDSILVWSSKHCGQSQETDKVVLQPGTVVARGLVWEGETSTEQACSAANDSRAEAGPYQLYAVVGEVYSPAATFNLSG